MSRNKNTYEKISNHGEFHVARGRESNMNCPFLAGKDMLSCAALKDVYVPSSFELDEYCKQTLHKMCRRYLRVFDVNKNT